MTTTTELLRRAAKTIQDNATPYCMGTGGTPETDDETDEQLEVAASLLALADQMERAEPVAWMESPYGAIKANPAYRMNAPQALAWQIPLYTHPAPEVTRDAERYRWLRAGIATERGEPWVITRYAPGDERNRDGGTCPLAGDELDAAIDAAMQEPKP